MITSGLNIVSHLSLIEIHQTAFQIHLNHCFKEIVNNLENFNWLDFIGYHQYHGLVLDKTIGSKG